MRVKELIEILNAMTAEEKEMNISIGWNDSNNKPVTFVVVDHMGVRYPRPVKASGVILRG